jgi:hypothetical protein
MPPIKTRRDGLDRIFGGAAALVVLMWIAYAWEASTGLTFASRNTPGKMSTADHLAKSRRTATGITILCLPPAVVYFAFLRPRE